MDERKSEKKKLFPLAVNRARVNYHSSGERDAQKRSARARARWHEKGQKGSWTADGKGGWNESGGGGWHPADLVNGEPEASKLTPIRHTYEKAFRLVVRTDLCQLRREAAATNFTRVPSEEAKAWWKSKERDAPVDIHKLAKLRELRFCSKSLLEGASASASRTAMVLRKYHRIFLVLYFVTVNCGFRNFCFIWKAISWLRDRCRKLWFNLGFYI